MRRSGPRSLALLLLAALSASPAPAQEGLASLRPVPVDGNTLFVTESDLGPPIHGAGGRRVIRTDFSARARGVPVLGPVMAGEAAGLLRRLHAEGRAAGNTGDLYENRDREHSLLDLARFPQLTRIRYGPLITADRRDYGASGVFIFDAPLIGNSSTAETKGPFWRSQGRALLTHPTGTLRLYQNYRAGQIYVYPEHRDHDPRHGDLIPANTPYMLISQGSSYTDKPHLETLAMILAAFQPETKAKLKATGLLAPTVQMVYRRSMAHVRSRETYLSGLAHPSVFPSEPLDPARAVALANSIAPDAIPPVVALEVLSETRSREGIDHFGRGVTERFFDTPAAIARIWRSKAGRREMVVTAKATEDPGGRPLSFDWVLLRGDPERVSITPLDESGATVRITMDWQEPRPVPRLRPFAPGNEMGDEADGPRLSSRIDIGAFASNGVHDSAPSFVSVLLPAHETRIYSEEEGAPPRILSIDRSLPEERYADPRIFPRMGWADTYSYDGSGMLTGWTRREGAATIAFDADGNGPQGRPDYAIVADEQRLPHIQTRNGPLEN